MSEAVGPVPDTMQAPAPEAAIALAAERRNEKSAPRRPPRPSARGDRLKLALGWLVIAVVVFGGWQLFAALRWVNPTFAGKPSSIFTSLAHGLTGKMLTTDAVATTEATVLGFAVAAVAGILVAFLLTQVPYLRRATSPYLTALNSLPRVALAPVFVIWLGIGLAAHAVIAGSLTFFVVLANTMAGVDSVDPDHILLARLQGATRWQTFVKYIIPSGLPSIFVGLELGFIFGMLGEVSGEMIAGQAGLGVRLTGDGASFNMSDYFATLFLLVIITTIFALLFQAIGRRLLRWQEGPAATRRRGG